jgi:hypothetical protein
MRYSAGDARRFWPGSAIAIRGTTAYLGGKFTSLRPAGDPLGTGEVARSHAAARVRQGRRQDPRPPRGVNSTTGAVLAWKTPAVNGQVSALAVGSGVLYAGGTFTTVGGGSHPHLAAFYLATATFDPNWLPSVDAQAKSIAVTRDGTHVIVAGAFTQLDGRSRRPSAPSTPSPEPARRGRGTRPIRASPPSRSFHSRPMRTACTPAARATAEQRAGRVRHRGRRRHARGRGRLHQARRRHSADVRHVQRVTSIRRNRSTAAPAPARRSSPMSGA